MVRALVEAHRVLVPQGIMIDIRPLSLDAPLEIVYECDCKSAGILDMSPGREIDHLADEAIKSVLHSRLFLETKVEYFPYTYYWTTLEGMEDDIKENWQGEINISEEIWTRARILINQSSLPTKIRVATKMKLGLYLKQE